MTKLMYKSLRHAYRTGVRWATRHPNAEAEDYQTLYEKFKVTRGLDWASLWVQGVGVTFWREPEGIVDL